MRCCILNFHLEYKFRNVFCHIKSRRKEYLNPSIVSSSCTGKSLSEALVYASNNPQYDDRLFIELQVQCMKIPSSNMGRTCCVQKLFLLFLYTTCSPHVLQKEELLTKIYLYLKETFSPII